MSTAPTTRTAPAAESRARFWHAVRLVARREFTERIRDRGFLMSVGVMLAILLAAVAIPAAVGRGGDGEYKVAFSGPQQAQLGNAATAQARLLDVDLTVATFPDADAARKAVKDGDADALVGDGRITVNRELPDKLAAVLQSAYASVERGNRLAAQGFDVAAVDKALEFQPLAKQTLDPDADEREARKGIAVLGTIMLYGMLMLFCMWVANGVVEEKSSRIVEILMATVPARALLTGKIIGIGLLGLLQMALTATVGLTAASAVGTIDLTAAMVYPAVLVVAWFVLGYAIYACMFAAAASRVSRMEDLQNVITPMTTVLISSFFIAISLGQSDNTFARVLAYIPPFSAMLQPIQTAGGDLAVWQNLLAAALSVLALFGLVGAAARMYEGAVLRTGGKVSLKDAWGTRS
ncbi:ABC transporter permease [Yinghuangia seranimata]|uniref:ABC transporter permease n=1 Tax=Yinghuangia seranimata TaxID=408067 RepID=UPI00248B3318|nr:ABC transporter permease [Yinghuangia seranimata]MDI2128709.1 ABC transporter permease [Yinghuangia seranimata]